MQLIKPTPFTDAVAKLGSRTLIGSALNSSQWSAVPVALRERALFSSTIESLRFLQRTRDSLDAFLTSSRETLPNGDTALKAGSRAEFVRQLQNFAIAEGMGPLDPADAGTIKDITSEKRLALIFDTQIRQAYDYGDYVAGQDPAVLDAYPAQRFIRVIDVQTPRDEHRQYEDQVQLKTNTKFWTRINADFGVPWGPWGWGCGHDVEDVDRAEAESLGLIAPGDQPTPSLPSFNQNLQSRLTGLDPDLRQFLTQSFGPKITLASDTAQWTDSAPSPAPK